MGKIIKTDHKAIDKVKFNHEKFIKRINDCIAKIVEQGVSLNDNQLHYVIDSPEYIMQLAENQFAEAHGQKTRFPFFQERIAVDCTPLTQAIEDATDLLHKFLYQTREQFIKRYITYKDGKAVFIPNIGEMLEKEYSITLDTPEQEEAWRLANELCDKINEFEAYVKEHGDGKLHSVSQDVGIYNRTLVLLGGKFYDWTWRATPYPEAIKNIVK